MSTLAAVILLAGLAACCSGTSPSPSASADTLSTVVAERVYLPGDTVPAAVVRRRGAGAFFTVSALSDSVFSLMQGKSYGKGCSVPRTSLCYLTCLHVTADGHTLVGEMVLAKDIAAKVNSIFRQLYDARYPIERMRLIDNYDASDERSMAANNSSGFNYRCVSGSKTISKHGRGLAVDLNPLYNPCRRTLKSGQVKVEPAAGAPYADRAKKFAYKIERGDLCFRLFHEAGFRWGGDWRTVKDYQHFEKP